MTDIVYDGFVSGSCEKQPLNTILERKEKMFTQNKGKEVLKITGISLLSLSLFCAIFIGFNRLTFAAATDGMVPLPPAAVVENFMYNVLLSAATEQPGAAEYDALTDEDLDLRKGILEMEHAVQEIDASLESNTFVPADITVLESPWQYHHRIVDAALPIDVAAQIGAQYIWEMFGIDLNGMYVQMMFASHASQINTWWTGSVFTDDPNNPQINYFVSNFDPDNRIPLPVIMFTIDGITGARIDINYMGYQGRVTNDAAFSVRGEMGAFMYEIGWRDMDLSEQRAFTNITEEDMRKYFEKAMHFAAVQFNNSQVVSLYAAGLGPSYFADRTFIITNIRFIAVDDTGREAIISVSTEGSATQPVSVSTQHNDFIPGFHYRGGVHG